MNGVHVDDDYCCSSEQVTYNMFSVFLEKYLVWKKDKRTSLTVVVSLLSGVSVVDELMLPLLRMDDLSYNTRQEYRLDQNVFVDRH